MKHLLPLLSLVAVIGCTSKEKLASPLTRFDEVLQAAQAVEESQREDRRGYSFIVDGTMYDIRHVDVTKQGDPDLEFAADAPQSASFHYRFKIEEYATEYMVTISICRFEGAYTPPEPKCLEDVKMMKWDEVEAWFGHHFDSILGQAEAYKK